MREDWIEVELGELFFTTSGGTPSRTNKNYYKGDIPWVKSGELDKGTIKETEEHISLEAVKNSSAKIYPKGTLLIALYGATIGKLAFLGVEATSNQAICGIYRRKNINHNFLFFFLSFSKSKLIGQGTGGAQPNISQTILKKLSFPLAPLPVQRAIVQKIETLFSDLDNGIANLKKAQEQLKIYRQAVLKKAFEGELTAEWRKQRSLSGEVTERSRSVEVPTATELLAQIKEERQNHYNKQIEEWKAVVKEWENNGKEGKKPGKPSQLKEFNSSIRKLNLDIPSNWYFEHIGNLSTGVQYGSSSKSLDNGIVPVLRMGNMQNGIIDWSNLKYSSNQEEINQYLLHKGDVLFNRTNSPELVGKTVEYKGETEAIFAGYLIRINQINSIIKSSYLNLFLNSHPAKVYGSYVKTDGVNQSNINGQKLSNYPIPVCGLEEQNQIVQEIESRLSVCDQVEQTISNSLEKAKALRQSILKKAFEGRLLSESEINVCKQEADYEPASILLEKIKAEKLAAEQKPKKKSTKKKAKK